MLKRVYTSTGGAWDVVELDNGERYMLTSANKAANVASLHSRLVDVAPVGGLVDRGTAVDDAELPSIVVISWFSGGERYRLRDDQGNSFEVSPEELKTILTA